MTRLVILVLETFFWRKWILAKASGLGASNSKKTRNHLSPSLMRRTSQPYLLSLISENSSQIECWLVQNNCLMCPLIRPKKRKAKYCQRPQPRQPTRPRQKRKRSRLRSEAVRPKCEMRRKKARKISLAKSPSQPSALEGT
jgi:hypothetical protein